jgi:hypothetical protein
MRIVAGSISTKKKKTEMLIIFCLTQHFDKKKKYDIWEHA